MARLGIASNFARLVEIHGGIHSLDGVDRPDGLESLGIFPDDSRLILGIEHLGESDYSKHRVQIACFHMWEHEGETVCDPDVVFEVDPGNWQSGHWLPIHFRQEATGYERCGMYLNRDTNHKVIVPREVKRMETFVRRWNQQIKDQGYIELYEAIAAGRDEAKRAARRKKAAPVRPESRPVPNTRGLRIVG